MTKDDTAVGNKLMCPACFRQTDAQLLHFYCCHKAATLLDIAFIDRNSYLQHMQYLYFSVRSFIWGALNVCYRYSCVWLGLGLNSKFYVAS